MISDVIKVNIEQLVKNRGKTLYSVAKSTGISYNTLFNMKKGGVSGISFDVLERLCKELNCSPNDLPSLR